jgi:hypothetical protein
MPAVRIAGDHAALDTDALRGAVTVLGGWIGVGRRKPMPFSIERRLGVPFEENVFYCKAPVPTKIHLSALTAIEALARR